MHHINNERKGKKDTLVSRIGRSGGLGGDTVGYSGESQKVFESICRKWWKAYLAEY